MVIILLPLLCAAIYWLHWSSGELRAGDPVKAKLYARINCVLVAILAVLLVLWLD